MEREKLQSDFQESYDKYYPFLLEIRKRLFYVAALFVVSTALGFIYYERVIRGVLSIFRFEGVNIVFTSPFQFMNLAISSGILIGTITVFPILVSQILSFLRPALSDKEYRTLIILIPLSLVLFVGGFSFGSIMMRYIVALFYQKSLQLDVGNFLDISKLLSQILVTAAAMGMAFQFPIVLTILMRVGLVKYKAVSGQRMIAYASSIVFAAFLPPTDLLSLFALTAPLIILFESTMIVNRFFLKTHALEYT